jgi:hypothetical protein
MILTGVSQLIYTIWFVLGLIDCAQTEDDSYQAKVNYKGKPEDSSILLMNSQQYHFVPVGSFFQYSIASWEEGYDGKYLSKSTLPLPSHDSLQCTNS